MSLPVSLVHTVHAAESLYQCPSCGRMIYYREAFARRVRQPTARRGEAPKIGIERFSSQELMIPQLVSGEREFLRNLRPTGQPITGPGTGIVTDTDAFNVTTPAAATTTTTVPDTTTTVPDTTTEPDTTTTQP